MFLRGIRPSAVIFIYVVLCAGALMISYAWLRDSLIGNAVESRWHVVLQTDNRSYALTITIPTVVVNHQSSIVVNLNHTGAGAELPNLVMIDSEGHTIKPSLVLAPDVLQFDITPKHAGMFPLTIMALDKNGNQSSDEIHVGLEAGFTIVQFAWRVALLGLGIFLLLMTATVLFRRWLVSRQQQLQKVEAKIEQAEIKAQEQPEKAKFAWDLARVKLEAYFDRNLSQVNQVFLVAIIVMCVGFAFVLLGVFISFQGRIQTSWVAAGSGIITQFIGATFMVIYRSTMAQANEFMLILERINTVGMSVQVLESIPENEKQLKNETRAQIVELLLNSNIPAKLTGRLARKKASAGAP